MHIFDFQAFEETTELFDRWKQISKKPQKSNRKLYFMTRIPMGDEHIHSCVSSLTTFLQPNKKLIFLSDKLAYFVSRNAN